MGKQTFWFKYCFWSSTLSLSSDQNFVQYLLDCQLDFPELYENFSQICDGVCSVYIVDSNTKTLEHGRHLEKLNCIVQLGIRRRHYNACNNVYK